jgi:hypothetical protein
LPGGPVGVVFGAAGGALLGRAADAINLEDLTGFLDKVSRELPPGYTAIVAEVTEQTQGNLDMHIQAIGGTIIRDGPASPTRSSAVDMVAAKRFMMRSSPN